MSHQQGIDAIAVKDGCGHNATSFLFNVAVSLWAGIVSAALVKHFSTHGAR